MIELSLNEVETLSAKAARGAGFAWGLADEIGRAAVALARAGRDWSGELLKLLGEAHGFAAPGERGTICPVRTAAWLNDAPPGEELTLCDVGRPVWLAAMLMGFDVETDFAAARAEVRVKAAVGGERGRAHVVRLLRPRPRGDDGLRRAAISQTELDALAAYAARTYVPESESSRRRGAGGGRVDDE